MDDSGDFSADEIERGRKLFAGQCDFMLGVVSLETLPDEMGPEIAFAGRSNVGKSTLLNALTGRKNLARASNTPGRTREINYFDLSNGALRLVDLPGYGYARASRSDVEKWTELVRDFLRGRAALRRVCVLVDSRHGLKPTDIEILDMLDDAAVTYQIILTKTDKIKPTVLAGIQKSVFEAVAKRPAAHPILRPTSSETGDGIAQLRADIATLTMM